MTGRVLSETDAHVKEVSGLAYCGETRCLVTYGADGCIHVYRDAKTGLEHLRSVENAHKTRAMTCMCHAPALASIATGDAGGDVVVWAFETLQQHARLRLPAACSAITALEPRPLLATGDADGGIVVWSLRESEPGYLEVTPRLRFDAQHAVTGLASLGVGRDDECLVAATDAGNLVSWAGVTWADLPSAQPPMESARPSKRPGFKPYRKVVRDMAKCEAATQVVDAWSKGCHADPSASTKAHDEAVLHVLTVEDPAAVYTTSADGVQRLWRPSDLTCCGDFDLPNKLEDVKGTIPSPDWDYFAKAPPKASVSDEALATRLLDDLGGDKKARKKDVKKIFQRAVRKVMFVQAFGGSRPPERELCLRDAWCSALREDATSALSFERTPPVLCSSRGRHQRSFNAAKIIEDGLRNAVDGNRERFGPSERPRGTPRRGRNAPSTRRHRGLCLGKTKTPAGPRKCNRIIQTRTPFDSSGRRSRRTEARKTATN